MNDVNNYVSNRLYLKANRHSYSVWHGQMCMKYSPSQ